MAYSPTNSSAVGSHANFITGSRFAKEFVFDRPIVWLLENPNIQNATGPANLVSHGTNTISLAEMASSEVCGFTSTASEQVISEVLSESMDGERTGFLAKFWALFRVGGGSNKSSNDTQ